MKKVLLIWSIVILICSTVGVSVLPSIVATESQQNQIKIDIGDGLHSGKVTSEPYIGRLRIYIVEPVSRWNMYSKQPYHFGLLGFAFNENISIDPQTTLQKSIIWNGDVTEANAMVIAAVFNSEKNQGYANPPSSKPFWAYYTDASAAAIPGHTGYNTVNPAMAFTHTVFVEEGTATWCPYCPAMANTLNAIYESGDYPFYFVALVDDMNSQAASRLRSEYNIYGFPTGFFDGGYQLLLGGYDLESYYRPLIEACGQREVPTLNLSVSVTYIGNGDLQIGVNITNNNLPPTIPQAPSGNTNGNVGTEYIYTTTTTDPNNDKVRYWFDWDDGTNSGWIGPYPSGVIVNATHTWKTKGTYNIKVKAVDPSNSESNWSNSLPITMPYSYNPLLQFLELLFQRFPHAFPILRQLLGY